MRYADLFEITQVDSKIIDLLSILSSEGVESIPLDAIVTELLATGVDVDEQSLFDEMQDLPIVNNIKDGIVYFNTSSMDASNLNKVDPEKSKSKVIKYIPHGLDHDIFKPINKFDSEYKKLQNSLEKDGKMEFKLLFNSRNIRRKCIPDTILAWKYFLNTLDKEKRSKCQFNVQLQ
jgi:hypothetical protein